MTIKLLTEQHFEFLMLIMEAAQVSLSLHLSKCHIVGNHMSRLISPAVMLSMDQIRLTISVEGH